MTKNAFSVDLESFIHRQLNPKLRIKKDENKTIEEIKSLLNLFDLYKTKITFFIVGEIFEWYPDLIKEIKVRGHEIGYHSHRHIILKDKNTLKEELALSKKFFVKYRPIGFRAPRMFLKKEYLSILKDFGFQYDSSAYGNCLETINTVKEIPVSIWDYPWISLSSNVYGGLTAKIFLRGIPFGSGFLVNTFGKMTQHFINFVNRQGRPAILFVHPWQFYDYEIDLPQEKSFINKFFLRRKINQTIEFLFSRNKFVPLREFL